MAIDGNITQKLVDQGRMKAHGITWTPEEHHVIFVDTKEEHREALIEQLRAGEVTIGRDEDGLICKGGKLEEEVETQEVVEEVEVKEEEAPVKKKTEKKPSSKSKK